MTISIFLSYDHRDAAKARTIANALEKAGHQVWWDRHIRGGSQFSKEIERALAGATAIVVMWSNQSIESPWVRDEAEAARDTGRLVPVRIDDSRPPLGFRQFQAIDLSGAKAKARSREMQALLDAIAAIAGGGDTDSASPGPDRRGAAAPTLLSRRTVAAGLIVAAVAGAGGYLALREAAPQRSPEVDSLLTQAWQAWTQGTVEGSNQAIGLYRRATEIAPDDPDTWGFLGCAFADRAHGAPAAERQQFRARAREAGQRALHLDPENAYGRLAVAYAQPVRGNWLEMEREFRRAIADQPEKWLGTYSLALLLYRLGRNAEAASLFATLRDNAATATKYYFHTQSLWAAGRPDEAERLLEEANAIYGSHPAIWWLRFQMLLHGGRIPAAIALAEDGQGRPGSIAEENVRPAIEVAHAALSRAPADIARAMASQQALARQSALLAENAIEYASLLRQLDDAFAIAGAYFFSRGFAVPDQRASSGGGSDVTLDSRETAFLFQPSCEAMRADPRFEPLVGRIGLTRYWREAKVVPDYRRQG